MDKQIVLATIIMLVLSMLFSITSRVTASTGSNVSTVETPLRDLSQDMGNKQPLVRVRGYSIHPDLSLEVNTTSQSGYYASGWQDGSIYPPSLTVQNASTVAASIDVPNIPPLSDELYYVLLSVVDSNGSYDQIGLCALYGTWTLLYSWTTGPPDSGRSYHYDNNSMTLSQGTTYTFSIAAKEGVAYFAAYQGSTNVWHKENVTGGNYLMLNYTDPYWGNGYEDYTCYEEVYWTNLLHGVPGFNFYFHDQYWVATNGSSYSPTWTNFAIADVGYTVPDGISVLIDGGDVYIWNPGVVPSQYPVSTSVSSVDPVPPHYSVVQIYHNGMLKDGGNTWNTYDVTVSRTDNDTSILILFTQVGLKGTNVNNASDYRIITAGIVMLTSGATQSCNIVWNETSTMDPGIWNITGFANPLYNYTFDMNPSDDQITNDTVHAVELLGDINVDGNVNVLDSILLATAFNSAPGDPKWNVNADLNMDGRVDILDAIMLSNNFGQTLTGSGDSGSSDSLKGSVQPATAGNSSVVVDPGQVTVFKGEVFTVNVTTTGVTDLQGWEFKLYWNSTVLNCTNAAVVTPTVWQGQTQDDGPGLEANYNSTHGRFWKAEAANYPAPSFNGSMTIATLTFQALQPGTTSLALTDTLLGNSTAQPMACTVSSGSVTVYTGRYMRSDTQTINGLNAYKLNVPESTSSSSDTEYGDTAGAWWGIRAWVRHSNGTEQEISLGGQTGTPAAVVYRYSGMGLQSATVTVAQTALQPTDSLVIRVYTQAGSDSGWTLSATFTTEQLQATTLQATTWTTYYYTFARWNRYIQTETAILYWGTTTYNSRIQNLQYT